jgi:carbohydrate binding protein with CBM6 domain/glycosyl hydrolase family 26
MRTFPWKSRVSTSMIALFGCAAWLTGCAAVDSSESDPLTDQDEDAVTAVSLPGRVQAESYKAGGEGVGYHDTTATNLGGQLHTDGVDIGVATDTGGGHYVGWTEQGEWLAYRVNVASAGKYDVTMRASTGTPEAKKAHLEIDGATVGTLTLAGDDDWQSWKNVTITATLPAGAHTLKLVFDTAKININYLDVKKKQACTVSSKLVPSCGAWFGAASKPKQGETYEEAIDRIEGPLGRKFDIVQSYQQENDPFPTATQKQWSSEGRYLLLNWKPVLGTGGWKKAASGSADASIIGPVADRIKAFGKPLFLAVWHEPENDTPPIGKVGSVVEYIAMWHHVRAVFDQHGVTNVVWTYKTMQYCPNIALSQQMYPGNGYVDWLAVDTYNVPAPTQNTWLTMEQTVNKTCANTSWPGFYSWATENHPDKPVMVGELGTKGYPGNDSLTKQWFIDGLDVLKTKETNIKALVYFDGPGTGGDWRLENTPAGVAGFKQIGQDPYLKQAHP